VLGANGHHATINFVYKILLTTQIMRQAIYFFGGGDGSKVQKARAVDIE
jgi:hypothetical protein